MRTVELGAQSFSDKVLALNGRGHTAAQIEAAFALLRENGFTVGLQIMTGLPGQTEAGLALSVGDIGLPPPPRACSGFTPPPSSAAPRWPAGWQKESLSPKGWRNR